MNDKKFNTLIIDVDGVMTDGKFYYTENGKVSKRFGPDDHDALRFIESEIKIIFITADKKGFKISKKRIVDDMGFDLELIGSFDRKNWLVKNFNPSEGIYIADGLLDFLTMKIVGYSIAPNDASTFAKQEADFITLRNGGDRCVAEAVFHIVEKFFDKNFLRDFEK